MLPPNEERNDVTTKRFIFNISILELLGTDQRRKRQVDQKRKRMDQKRKRMDQKRKRMDQMRKKQVDITISIQLRKGGIGCYADCHCATAGLDNVTCLQSITLNSMSSSLHSTSPTRMLAGNIVFCFSVARPATRTSSSRVQSLPPIQRSRMLSNSDRIASAENISGMVGR